MAEPCAQLHTRITRHCYYNIILYLGVVGACPACLPIYPLIPLNMHCAWVSPFHLTATSRVGALVRPARRCCAAHLHFKSGWGVCTVYIVEHLHHAASRCTVRIMLNFKNSKHHMIMYGYSMVSWFMRFVGTCFACSKLSVNNLISVRSMGGQD